MNRIGSAKPVQTLLQLVVVGALIAACGAAPDKNSGTIAEPPPPPPPPPDDVLTDLVPEGYPFVGKIDLRAVRNAENWAMLREMLVLSSTNELPVELLSILDSGEEVVFAAGHATAETPETAAFWNKGGLNPAICSPEINSTDAVDVVGLRGRRIHKGLCIPLTERTLVYGDEWPISASIKRMAGSPSSPGKHPGFADLQLPEGYALVLQGSNDGKPLPSEWLRQSMFAPYPWTSRIESLHATVDLRSGLALDISATFPDPETATLARRTLRKRVNDTMGYQIVLVLLNLNWLFERLLGAFTVKENILQIRLNLTTQEVALLRTTLEPALQIRRMMEQNSPKGVP